MPAKRTNQAFIQDIPIILNRPLALEVGLSKSIILLTIHYFCQPGMGGDILPDGRTWAPMTWSKLRRELPFIPEEELGGLLHELKAEGYLLESRSNGARDRKTRYRTTGIN